MRFAIIFNEVLCMYACVYVCVCVCVCVCMCCRQRRVSRQQDDLSTERCLSQRQLVLHVSLSETLLLSSSDSFVSRFVSSSVAQCTLYFTFTSGAARFLRLRWSVEMFIGMFQLMTAGHCCCQWDLPLVGRRG